MGLWGGAGPPGCGSSTGPQNRGGAANLKRSTDGWDDEELGKVYDHKVVRRMLPYLKPYRLQVILATLSMVIFSFASLAPYYLIALATDHWIKDGNMSGLALIGVALVALAIVGWATQYIQQVTTGYAGHKILLTLRMEMFNHIEKLPVSFLDKNEI